MVSQFIFICWLSLSLKNVIANTCTTSNNVMNCSGLTLIDCPLVNSDVTDLNLNGNVLEDLTTRSCDDWVHLDNLSVSSNKLQVVPNFQTFHKLKILNLSNNIIWNVTISSRSLLELDISRNAIVDAADSKLDNLTIFMAAHNNIDTASMGRIFEMLKNCPYIQIVDVSYNLIDYLPNQMRSFRPQHLSYINFAGNKLRVIDFGLFHRDIGQGYLVDLSYNFITKLSIRDVINVRYLNLSNNKLSLIDGQMMRNFVGLKGIDLSHNPINCLCSKSASFIKWIQEQHNIIYHPQKTKCKIPSFKSIETVSYTYSNLLVTIYEQSKQLLERFSDQNFISIKRQTITNRKTTTRPKTSTTKRKTSTTRRKTSTTRRKTSTTRRKTSTTRRKTSTTRRNTPTTRRETPTTRRMTLTTKRIRTTVSPNSTTKRPSQKTRWWIYVVGFLAAAVIIIIIVIIYSYLHAPRRLFYRFVTTNETI